MKLIRELNEDVQYNLVEDAGGKKHLYIEGVFLQSAITNRNGRVYPTEVLEREVNKYVAEKVTRNSAFGELGHPSGPKINEERISHVITELKRDGTNFVGKARLVDEGLGKIARGIIEAGGRLGVSSRGLGSLKEKGGIHEVQADFRLATAADIVADPSAPDAYVKGILEGVEFFYDEKNDRWNQVIEATREEVKEVADRSVRELEEKTLKLWESFLERMARIKN